MPTSPSRETFDKLLNVLGRRLREGEDALRLLAQMEGLPEGPAKATMVASATTIVKAWADGVKADVQAISAELG